MMKMTRILKAMAVAATLFAAAPAFADTAPQQSFAIVDTGRVLQSSKAAKSVSDALDAKRKEFAAQIGKEQDSLRADGQKLQKAAPTLSKEQGTERLKAFHEKEFNLQKMVQNREILIEKALNQSMTKLRDATRDVVGEIAKEKGFAAVLTQDAVMLSVPQMDITTEVVKRLDDKVKSIPIDWEALAKEGKENKDAKGKKAG
jgi:outer membrane protein